MLQRGALQRVQCGAKVKRVGELLYGRARLHRHLEHVPAGGRYRQRDAEIVQHFKLADAVQRIGGQGDGQGEPVVAKHQGIFQNGQACQVAFGSAQHAKVDAAVLEFPIAVGRHARVARRGGHGVALG